MDSIGWCWWRNRMCTVCSWIAFVDTRGWTRFLICLVCVCFSPCFCLSSHKCVCVFHLIFCTILHIYPLGLHCYRVIISWWQCGNISKFVASGCHCSVCTRIAGLCHCSSPKCLARFWSQSIQCTTSPCTGWSLFERRCSIPSRWERESVKIIYCVHCHFQFHFLIITYLFVSVDDAVQATTPWGRTSYIYGRYKCFQSVEVNESFFPIVYASSGQERTSWLDDYIQGWYSYLTSL